MYLDTISSTPGQDVHNIISEMEFIKNVRRFPQGCWKLIKNVQIREAILGQNARN